MLLSAALMRTPLCLAELASDAPAQAPELGSAAAADQRALLLYLGEFDPALDPVELSQIDDPPAGTQKTKTDAKTAAESSAHAAHEPKN